jgi:tocopherol cyclase
MHQLYKIKHPEIFQGNLKKSPYFEGWYTKVIDKSKKYIFAFIFAISIDKKNNTSHAFIEFFNGTRHYASYLRFPVEQFSASSNEMLVKIGPNTVTNHSISLDLDGEGQRVQGELNFIDIVRLPKQGIGHGIMGPTNYVPFLECRHDIVNVHYTITGTLTVNGEKIDFTGGKGYTEKDWGASFPIGYSWLHCNNFEKDDVSIFASIAIIPYLGLRFMAYIAAFLLDGKVYRFAIYNRDKLKIESLENTHLKFTLASKKYELEIEGFKTPGIDLPSPTRGGMNATISESLTSKIIIRFFDIKNGLRQLKFEDTGYPAGIEIQITLEQLKRWIKK